VSNKDCSADILNLLLGLSPELRRWYLQNCDNFYRSLLEKVLGKEAVEILSKTRVELKIVLNTEEALPLIKRFGKEWRERAREAVRKALKSIAVST
jgi:hypothetical protein